MFNRMIWNTAVKYALAAYVKNNTDCTGADISKVLRRMAGDFVAYHEPETHWVNTYNDCVFTEEQLLRRSRAVDVYKDTTVLEWALLEWATNSPDLNEQIGSGNSALLAIEDMGWSSMDDIALLQQMQTKYSHSQMFLSENKPTGLTLHNPALQGVDPFSKDLTPEQQAAVKEECLINPQYFFRECVR